VWSPWKDLAYCGPPGPDVLGELLDGGQSFRWTVDSQGIWTGAWAQFTARLRCAPHGSALQWSAPRAEAQATYSALRRYLDADRDVELLIDVLPWRSDDHLARAIQAFPGLRILRQPFGEALLCFICSAAKQIVQIKQIAAALAALKGSAAAGRAPALPTWTELAAHSEAELRGCKLGFRARYVHRTAQFLAAHPGWLDETEALPYAEAKKRLLHLPGVGEKIADCVLLFGAGRLEAFPVDVWIIEAMRSRYGLAGWKPEQIAQFGRLHFGSFAGLAQQYLFAWERKNR
jgi:N-glycosylase/DNA lyase